jgi:MFS family permease
MTDIDTTQTPPASPPLAIPEVGVRYRIGFTLASMIAGISVCIKQLLLPLQISQLDPVHTYTSFTIVASLGALAGLVASPLSGALSDRTVSRFGRRRPWIVGGLVVALMGLALMATASSIALLLTGEILEQLGVDTILATVTALIPDRIPLHQRANTSALNGMAPVFGGVVWLVLVTGLTNTRSVMHGYLVLAICSVGCLLAFLGVVQEDATTGEQVPPLRWKAFISSFWHPLASCDFVLTLVSRLLVFLAFTLLGAFLLFYLQGVFQVSAVVAAQTLTTFQVVATLLLVGVALLTGTLAQRLHRLKPFVIVGALLMALALGMLSVLVLVPSWAALFVAAALFGCGFGAYLGVDIHLAVRVLPRAEERGKDLGIMYTSIFLPLILSPVIGAVALNVFHSFVLLFAVAALASVAAAGLIVPIRAVR